jgi:signal transduction histidine kinase
VSDTGPGIAYVNISKLFEPFFTTKKKGKGVGLGLSVAYGIIQEHGGSIFVRSTIGNGATFQVRLPLKQEQQG